MLRKMAVAIGITMGFAGAVFGHLPIDTNVANVDAASAVMIEDATLSQVAYQTLEADKPQRWLTFNGQVGQSIYLQLGLPVIDRLENYRPSLALVGPGLPEATLPFDIPDGTGAIVWPTAAIDQPEFFHEPFTGTDSWILLEVEPTLSTEGQYYVVAFNTNEQLDKLWVAIGRREQFGLNDILDLPETIAAVRAFHELPHSRIPCFVFPAIGLAVAAAGIFCLRRVAMRHRQKTPLA